MAKRPSSSKTSARTATGTDLVVTPSTPPELGQPRPDNTLNTERDGIGFDDPILDTPWRIKSDGKTTSVIAYPTVHPTVDVVLIGDSWAAFGWQRGTTQASISLSGGALLDLAGVLNIDLYNCPSGMVSVTSTDAPVIVAGARQQGREGFTSTTGKGQLADALTRASAGIDISQINIHEYACGATTAGIHDYGGGSYTSSAGSWDYDRPTGPDTLGGTYGCSNAAQAGYGWKIDGTNTTAWLKKQEWLQDSGHIGHPFRDYTLADMICHPPTGRCVVVMCIGGNDIIDVGHRYRYLDPFDATFDPTGNFTAAWDEVASASADSSVRRITNAIYALNPDAEVFWTSYLNFPVDDPGIPNARIVLPTDYASGGAPTDGPVGWNAYSGDGANPDDPEYSDPNHNLATLPTVYWPTGPGLPSFPLSWNINTPGFHRIYHAWNTLYAQKNYGQTHNFFRTWVAHNYADIYAWQGAGTLASPAPATGFPTYTYNYRWLHGDPPLYSGYYAGFIHFNGHRWNQIYGQILATYSDTGTTQNFISLVQQNPINWHSYQTIINKDLTTASMSRLFRGFQQPRMASMQTYFQNLGKKFWSLDLYDQVPAYFGTSQTDPDGVRCLPKLDFIDLHLSSSGNPKWCDLIAQHLLRKTTLLTRS